MPDLVLKLFDPKRKVNVSEADFCDAFRLFTLAELKLLQKDDYYFFRCDENDNVYYKALLIKFVVVYSTYVNVYAGNYYFDHLSGDDDRIIRIRSIKDVIELKEKYADIALI